MGRGKDGFSLQWQPLQIVCTRRSTQSVCVYLHVYLYTFTNVNVQSKKKNTTLNEAPRNMFWAHHYLSLTKPLPT